MQQTPDTPSSMLSALPNEVLSMILHHTMRSPKPVHLEHFWRLGRLLQSIRHGNDTQKSKAASCIKNPSSDSSASACSESFFFDQLDPGQIEHFRDWLLINSTCRRFRAWGKIAFFSEKIFLVRPACVKRLCKNIPVARPLIRHVIALLPPVYNPFYALPQYQPLERLRTLVISRDCSNSKLLSMSNGPQPERCSFPEELLSLVQDIGLQINQLKIYLEVENQIPTKRLEQVHTLLQTSLKDLQELAKFRERRFLDLPSKGRRQEDDYYEVQTFMAATLAGIRCSIASSN